MAPSDNGRPRRRMMRAVLGFLALALFMYVSIMWKIVNYGP